ncbi:MAG TPA: DNA internalization-related competence protein ComEC/Rec2 [Gemmatimonadales bacterium]|nr:DNA internalization-related competence protein ComEC/Rec2 [Gemmatimonadales bacterium]
MSARAAPMIFTAAFGAGLATGLLRFPATLATGIALLATVLTLSHRGAWGALILSASTLGLVHAALAIRREAKGCAARLPTAEFRLTLVLEEPADAAGGVVQVRPVGSGCLGSVRARWPRGVALPAGVELRARARWVPRPHWSGRAGGTLVVTAVTRGPVQAASLADRLRNSVSVASRHLYGSRAPLVDALVVGRRAEMNSELKDAFAQSGLVHLLSISGFHVGLFAAWIVLAARALRVRRERALVLAAGAAALYVAFLGWPAPATRAAALAAVLALSRVRQRQVQADPLLVATCLGVMLVDPWAVLDLGGWLSAAALWGATACTRWSDRAVGTHAGWRCLAASVGATLATAPLTAIALGTVAVVGIALNFAAIPIAAAAVPGVAASLLAWSVWPGMAEGLATGSGLLLHSLELLARAGAAVPGGHVVTEPGPLAALPWAAGLVTLLWGMYGRATRAIALRRWSLAAAVVLWVLLARTLGPSPDPDGTLALHFLDVGQGDAAVIRTPGGHFVVVDAGPRSDRVDAGRRVVAPFLVRQRARRIAALVVSHAHADHVGGAVSVLDRIPAAVVLEPGAIFDDPGYTRFLSAVAAAGVPWRPGRPGDSFTLDGVRFTLLHPDPGWSGWGEDLNEDSLVLLVEYGGFRALFPGDAGFPAERHLAGRTGGITVLKVGHHGSRGSTGNGWLTELQPRVAVISVGANTYGHPAAETLARLAANGVDIRRTDRDRTVSVLTDGSSITVRSSGRDTTYSLASPAP